jgi:hypothetical protein
MVPPQLPVRNIEYSLIETPTEDRSKEHRQPDDCHVLIRWSQLVDLVKKNLTCACGKPVLHFERRTIGIATELDYRCSSCKKTATAFAGRSDYVEEKLDEHYFY